TTGGTSFAGTLDGGAGLDSLLFTSTDRIRIDGVVTGFETIALTGNSLDIAGTLGTTDGSIGFGDGAQHVTVLGGGTLAGSIDLGAGDDSIDLLAGSLLSGTVTGGAGFDLATVHLSGAMVITANVLSQFERITFSGNAPVTIGSGTSSVDRLEAEGGLSIGTGATLNAGQVQFGGGDNQFAIAGWFSGSADGGAGTDTLALSGGSQAAPIALGNAAGFETLQESAGFTSISGTAGFSSVMLTGGRLVGLAGSTISAPQIGVGAGAIFGSAGNVTGNIAVAGTLSPGASPGTMTVTGNVALATGSTTLFEITPTVTDKLLISGTLNIASGATLSLTGDRPLTPGSTLDLIVADGGISGSFSTIAKPASIFGFVAQRGNRIQLLGQFANSDLFAASARRSIEYVNGVLTGGTATAGLLNALPSLLTASGTSNPGAFTRLSPEAYASAHQIGVENGLVLVGSARDRALANGKDSPGAFSFAEGIGARRDLKGSSSGAARADINGYGLLGGLGWDGGDWAIGAFTGYLDSRQNIARLGARNDADGIIAGIQARYTASNVDLGAMLAYDGGDARTRRALPSGGTATGRYSLHNWTADLSIATGFALSSGWSLRPQAGISYIWTNRGAVSESGGSPFALAVARSRDHAGFADAGLRVVGGKKDGDRFHPYATLGGRYQFAGRDGTALASLGGGSTGLIGEGVERGRLLATASAGMAFDISAGMTLFAAYNGEWGKDDGRQGGRVGLRFGF
ncbi:MAG: autotransporter outer rane beta-barrel protein, partial [Rhizorhabdus sp.]|nr:autotransporter outer rane beta-barrel protein [Rhizorhabdus sp.]